MIVADYTIAEIAWWLIVAAAVGFAVGWILRKFFLGRKLDAAYAAIRSDEEYRRKQLHQDISNWKARAAVLSKDLERAQAQLDEGESRAAQLAIQLKASSSESRRYEAQVIDRESTIASLRSDVENLRAKYARLEGRASEANETISSLRADVDAKDGEIAALENRADDDAAKVLELEQKVGGATAVAARIDDLEQELKTAIEDRDATAARLTELDASHAACAERQAADSATIARLEAALAEAAPVQEAAPTLSDDDELPVRAAAAAKLAEIANRTRGAGPSVDDDLKKIRGIGPKLEGLLKSMDITSFRQVANFTAEDIQHVTAALDAFPGRIERDDWMSSAADEHSKKYGEPV